MEVGLRMSKGKHKWENNGEGDSRNTMGISHDWWGFLTIDGITII
jgi:hypothetical protein